LLQLRPDASLSEEVDRNWTEVFDMAFMFDRNAREAEALATVTKDEVWPVDILQW
jgi:hypothetical protein